ncbi:MAG: acetylserotonin O-methyltransferase [Desulfobacterota bacterium]|nr:acetylserotonin O-methyltransferase [Thermodesulfobacteriota bacterium]
MEITMFFGNELLDAIAAFMKARVILSAAALDIFTCLDLKPLRSDELAREHGLDVRATTRLLDCLVGMKLLLKDVNACYHLTEHGTLLSSRHPDTVLPMVLHMNTMWDNWTRLTETVRHGSTKAPVPVLGSSDPQITRAFIGAMHVIGRQLAREIATAYDMAGCRCLLDIGGGSGVYTIAFLERNPHLNGIIFDLPQVLPFAQEQIQRAGLDDRVRYVGGDFYYDALPEGADSALLSAIIHQNSPDENIALFKKVFCCLEPGGRLLIRDHIMEPCRTRPQAGALFAINMLVHTAGGDTYTFEEVTTQLVAAGFIDIKLLRSGERMDCLVEARKPATL